ncbi:C-C motif chemokine 4-like [Chelmon rostratus]|uniref:C-C motif chemokine 4-like n=1 Tax=Chelmon rostratus TaxID=109905 RepID=UPI001BE84723|nr:C-C motif chemokine 4-like [Chelmon rostratus]
MMMTMMKKPIILMTCVLLFSCLAVLASDNSFSPDECCFDFYSMKLPKNKVVSYKYTDVRCPKSAVILTMKRGGAFCVDPSLDWVKNIIKAKDGVRTKTVNSSGPRDSN